MFNNNNVFLTSLILCDNMWTYVTYLSRNWVHSKTAVSFNPSCIADVPYSIVASSTSRCNGVWLSVADVAYIEDAVRAREGGSGSIVTGLTTGWVTYYIVAYSSYSSGQPNDTKQEEVQTKHRMTKDNAAEQKICL